MKTTLTFLIALATMALAQCEYGKRHCHNSRTFNELGIRRDLIEAELDLYNKSKSGDFRAGDLMWMCFPRFSGGKLDYYRPVVHVHCPSGMACGTVKETGMASCRQKVEAYYLMELGRYCVI